MVDFTSLNVFHSSQGDFLGDASQTQLIRFSTGEHGWLVLLRGSHHHIWPDYPSVCHWPNIWGLMDGRSYSSHSQSFWVWTPIPGLQVKLQWKPTHSSDSVGQTAPVVSAGTSFMVTVPDVGTTVLEQHAPGEPGSIRQQQPQGLCRNQLVILVLVHEVQGAPPPRPRPSAPQGQWEFVCVWIDHTT